MVKNAGVGLQYLKLSLNLNLSSFEALDSDDGALSSFERVFKEHLEKLLPKEVPVEPRGHDLTSSTIIIGLQPVFDSLANETARFAFFDESCFHPSAVGSIIGLHIHNCSSTKSYCWKGLRDVLKSLNINAHAVAFTSECDSFNDFISSQPLKTVEFGSKQKSLTNNISSQALLSPAQLYKSIGKSNKKKKKGNK